MAEFDEFDALVEQFNVQYCVIDAQPERRLARDFARRHDYAWVAYYTASATDHGSDASTDDDAVIRLDRTQALDEMVARFREGSAQLPGLARQLGGRVEGGVGEYYRELMAPQRTLVEDARGNWLARWLSERKADHFTHAEAHCYAGGVILPNIAGWTYPVEM